MTDALVPARARERRPAPVAGPALRPEDLPSPIEKAGKTM